MNIFDSAMTLTLLADHYDGGWHPWPFFWIFPLLFWITVIAVVLFARRRCVGRGGAVSALREGFARGEITEDEYRGRLAVLSEPRGREKK
ncbi:SHOCT domain-containing protein [Nocardia salmonicida]|uniref:SHOCT domain-containing protein n=1 Tax=Nocardia salmonicida TaxID=53431 RepID=UPI0033D71342